MRKWLSAMGSSEDVSACGFWPEVCVEVLASTFSSLLLAWFVLASSVLGVSGAVVVSTAGASFLGVSDARTASVAGASFLVSREAFAFFCLEIGVSF